MEIKFYNKSVKELIESFGKNYKSDIIKALEILGLYGHTIEFPHSKSIGKGLFELRCLNTGARLFYCFDNNNALILHVIIKKQSKIPLKDLELARRRQKQVA